LPENKNSISMHSYFCAPIKVYLFHLPAGVWTNPYYFASTGTINDNVSYFSVIYSKVESVP